MYVQYNTINYYNQTKLSSDSPIDKKYIGMISSVLNYMLIFLPITMNVEDENNDYTRILQSRNQAAIFSLQYYNLVYNFLKSKILAQFKITGLMNDLKTDDDFIFFLNFCVKVVEDKDLDKYNDGTEIKGINMEGTYTDEELKTHNIFEDLDSFKNTCKIFLYLHRKKNCSRYIMPNNKLNIKYNNYRKCKISGFEPIKKPKEEINRLERQKEDKEAGESSDITDENRAVKQKEGFFNNFNKLIENYDNSENNIFKQVGKNLKLVFGYVLVLIIIGILIIISPTIFNITHTIISNYLVPAIVYILGVLAQMFTIVGKTLLMSGEGLFFFVVGLITPIFNILKIVVGMSADLLKDIFLSFMNIIGLSTSTLASKTGESTISLLGLSSKMFGDIGSTIFTKLSDFITLLFDIIIKSPGVILGNISKIIFDNSKKIYMTINNIEE